MNPETICIALLFDRLDCVFSTRNIGQYMSAHVVLNILNELGKR